MGESDDDDDDIEDDDDDEESGEGGDESGSDEREDQKDSIESDSIQDIANQSIDSGPVDVPKIKSSENYLPFISEKFAFKNDILEVIDRNERSFKIVAEKMI